MAVSLAQFVSQANQIWPINLADEWDFPGLVSGESEQLISKVLLTVDVTQDVLSEALAKGCQLIFAHHPLLLKGVKSVAVDSPKGRVLTQAIQNNVAIFAAHTNADVVENGVSDSFARELGLKEIKPLVRTSSDQIGHGRIGVVENAIKLGDLALALARLLPATASGIRVSGDYDSQVQTIALCGGAGDSFIVAAATAKADVYITSDLRHHLVQEAREFYADMNLVDVAHWASESLWLPVAASQLSQKFPDVEFLVSDTRTDSWDFTVTQ